MHVCMYCSTNDELQLWSGLPKFSSSSSSSSLEMLSITTEVKGQPPKVSSEVKGQPLPSANRPEPVYATVTKRTAKQEDPFGLSPFTAEGRQHSSPNPAYTASQRPPQSAPHQSPAATTRVPPHSNLDRSLDLFEPEPVRPGATKQTPRGGQQGVQYHSSSPWQQGADCFGAIPFVSVAAKDN